MCTLVRKGMAISRQTKKNIWLIKKVSEERKRKLTNIKSCTQTDKKQLGQYVNDTGSEQIRKCVTA